MYRSDLGKEFVSAYISVNEQALEDALGPFQTSVDYVATFICVVAFLTFAFFLSSLRMTRQTISKANKYKVAKKCEKKAEPATIPFSRHPLLRKAPG